MPYFDVDVVYYYQYIFPKKSFTTLDHSDILKFAFVFFLIEL